jgi:hypothetical protein
MNSTDAGRQIDFSGTVKKHASESLALSPSSNVTFQETDSTRTTDEGIQIDFGDGQG